MLVLVTTVLVALVLLIVTVDENNVEDRQIKDKDFEKEFVFLVSRVDKGNINWTQRYLYELKKGYRHYEDNDKAMSVLRVLRKGVKDNDPRVIVYIKKKGEMKNGR